MEGYLLYRALIIVFDTGHFKKLLLHIFGYGVPISISALTLIVGVLISTTNNKSTYHKSDLCWLENEYLYVAFYPPLIFMLCFNVFILVIGLRINLKVIQTYVN